MDIFGGISSNAVILVLQELSKEADTSKIEAFQQQINEAVIVHNSQVYRKRLAVSSLPCVPYLGMPPKQQQQQHREPVVIC